MFKNNNYNKEEYLQNIEIASTLLKEATNFKPEIVITLGSGLGKLADQIDVVSDYSTVKLPSFLQSTAPGHEGRLIFGNLHGARVACLKGRVHYYEGYDMWDIVFPLRVLYTMGARKLILTNAVGAINPNYKIGDFAAVNDAITQFVDSSLIGPNLDSFGERFIPINEMYDREYIKIAHKVAEENNITLHDSIYVQLNGPHYESPADIRMLGMLGADTVGMSTTCEAIAAKHMNMRIININAISNMAAGVQGSQPTSDEVTTNMEKNSENFTKLIAGIVDEIKS